MSFLTGKKRVRCTRDFEGRKFRYLPVSRSTGRCPATFVITHAQSTPDDPDYECTPFLEMILSPQISRALDSPMRFKIPLYFVLNLDERTLIHCNSRSSDLSHDFFF